MNRLSMVSGMAFTTPYPYQAEGVELISRFGGRALLADDMGLGKTLQALLWHAHNVRDGLTIVVCPSSLKEVWKREASKHIGAKSAIANGRSPRILKKGCGIGIMIINYDILHYWKAAILAMSPTLVVLDECHYIKSREAKRSVAAMEVAKAARHCIAISGTPVSSKPPEIWTTLNSLYPQKFPSYVGFASRYSFPYMIGGRWEYKGGRNLGELYKVLTETCMIRRLKKDVLTELPPKTRIVLPMEMERGKEYAKAAADFLGWLRAKSESRAERAAKNVALTKIGYLKRLAAQLKMPSVFEWIDTFLESGDKLVVFFESKAMFDALLARYGSKAVYVHGGVKVANRMKAVDRFQNDDDCKLFLGQIRAANTGLTLTAASSLLFVEYDWTPGEHAQAEDRIHRIGQLDGAMVYYSAAIGTIECDIVDVLCEKQAVLSQMLDGTSEHEAAMAFDIYQQLTERL